MSEHAEWAVRLDDGAVLVRCACGWQEHVAGSTAVAAAVREHKPQSATGCSPVPE